MTLTKPAVSELAVVMSTLDLWNEFLAAYFDGGPHDVGLNLAVPFPAAELLYQQSPITQPSDKVQPAPGNSNASLNTLAIALVWNDPVKKWIAWEVYTDGQGNRSRQQVAQVRASFNFWVRATGTKARAQGKLAGDRLCGLLNNSAATHALGQKGILRVRAQEPRAIPSDEFTLALVTATAQLRYPILSQGA